VTVVALSAARAMAWRFMIEISQVMSAPPWLARVYQTSVLGLTVFCRRCRTCEPRSTLAAHPHPFTLDAAVHLAAPAMLLQEGVEGSERLGHRGYSIT
jgi:hypothetical protein